MNQLNTPDEHGPNPERRSTGALICLCGGLGLMGLAWFLGLSGAIASVVTAATGPDALDGFVFVGTGLAAIGTGVLGGLMAIVGAFWLLFQVVADQSASDSYSRNVER